MFAVAKIMTEKEFAPFEPKWFKELKETRKDFFDVGNIIESAKFKYDRDFNTPKWLIATGSGILFSAGVLNLSSNLIPLLRFIATWGFIISAIELFIALIMIIGMDNRQKVAMAYLYREKDKQDRSNYKKNKK
jgi:hypothetical protein